MLKNIFNRIRYRINPIGFSRKIGVQIGINCRICGQVSFGSEPYMVKIGDNVSITNSSFITHDGGVWVFRHKYPDLDVIRPITIGNNVFIGSFCVILPGTEIEDNVVIGACSLVRGTIKSGGVYAGVPAKFIKSLDAYEEKCLKTGVNTKNLNRKHKEKFLKALFLKGDDVDVV